MGPGGVILSGYTAPVKECFMKVREIVTNMIIEKMKEGIIPWKSPYLLSGVHKNLISGKPYHGINVITTWLSGYATPYWVSYKQAQQLGGTVNKGEKSTMIVFYKLVEKEREGESEDKYCFPIMRYTPMFNVEQCTLPEGSVPVSKREVEDPVESCENIIEQYRFYGPEFNIGSHPHASYNVLKDIIKMPAPEYISGRDEYYSTLFHEMIHSTRHNTRLDRVKDKGDAGYAKEELVAEIGASMLCAEAGLSFKENAGTFTNHVAYIQSWMQHLENDSNFIISAASKASAAADFILNKAEKEEVAA